MPLVIEVKNLTKKFGEFLALDDVSFSVNSGEVFGYIGPNGAGKTTTIKAILGLLNPSSGIVSVLGEDVTKNEAFRWRIGTVLDSTGLYDKLSAFENLDFYGQIYNIPIDTRKKTITELLQFVGLSNRAKDLVGTYSKGMKQRLAIARALLHNPQVLIMDEPTSGLDPDAQLLIRELIGDLVSKRNITVLLSSHNLVEIEKICSKIAVIREGRIIEEGLIQDLKKKFAKPHTEIILSKDVNVESMRKMLSSLSNVVILNIAKDRVVVQCNIDTSDIVKKLMKHEVKIKEIHQGTASLEDIYQSLIHREEKP
ncbi:MAG: ABC transporter ATP-binding protein [Nitrososphaerota archaeon]|jgi:ABC-2 type transport system ATP-binding protein|nr:ABC transporter ATP-binding protein [Nitrososphaerota archaeon]